MRSLARKARAYPGRLAGQSVAPLDTALSANGLLLYTLDGAAGSISEFRRDESSQIPAPASG
jgi:hypothetical protein